MTSKPQPLSAQDAEGGAARLARDTRSLVRIARQVAPQRMLAQVVLLFAVGLIGGANLLLLIPIVNSLAAESAETVQLPGVGPIDYSGIPLWVLLAGVVALTAVQAGIQRASAINSASLNEAVATHMRTRAFDAVLAAEWRFVLDRRRSDIVSAVATGASRCGMALSEVLSGSVTVVVAVVTAVVALLVEPTLSAVAIVGTLILGAVLSTSIRPAYRMGGVFTDRYRALQGVMMDSLDSLRLIRAHNASDVWRKDLADAFAGTRDVQIAYVRQAATLSAAAQVGLVASAASLVLVAVWMEVPPTTIVVVLLLIARLARSVQSLASTAQRMANHLPGVREIEALTAAARAAVEQPEEAAGAAEVVLPEPVAGAPLVALRHASFRYSQGAGGIEDVSFEVPTGFMTALTGPSGAGKSTTADIVLGLLPPDTGEVLVEGRPLTRSGLAAWRSRVAYVPQETVLIPGTLRHNLQWSVGDVNDAACWRALDRAAARFARELPDGLDTDLGDRGIRLSGGERQRVAIARALLRSPDLLVLDEATSSLDDATEAEVLFLLTSLTPAITILVIAHRRSTIDIADHVIQFADGRVVSGADRRQGLP